MSTAEEKIEEIPETPAERLSRELASLEAGGILSPKLAIISRSTFHGLSPQVQMNFIRAGGQLADDPAPVKAPLPLGAIKRSTFDRMTSAVQQDFVRGGGFLIDDDLVADDPKGKQ